MAKRITVMTREEKLAAHKNLEDYRQRLKAEHPSDYTHQHRCHICEGLFDCSREDCGFEDRYAVCHKVACIADFEAPKRKEWDEDPIFDPCELTHDQTEAE